MLSKVLHGLPEKVLFCKRCVMSNQRPASTPEFSKVRTEDTNSAAFGTDGVCDACNFIEFKKSFNWEERKVQLEKLCDQHRSKDGSWDVIVPGSGGKDSIFVSHVLREEYGMHPLTVTWAPHAFTDVGLTNLLAWQNVGFDHMLVTPNPKIHAFISKEAFLRLLNPFQPFIMGQKLLAVKFALKLGIPFIMYGENSGERHTKFSDALVSSMDPAHFTRRGKTSEVKLGGMSIGEIVSKGFNEGELELYIPPKLEDLQIKGIEVHHMTHFVPWATQRNYYYAKEISKFETNPNGRSEGTYTKYASLDDKLDGLHYYTKFIKYGQGRCVDDVCRDIRDGYISREEAVALVNKYDQEFPEEHFDFFLEYLQIDRETFWQEIDKNRSPHLWTKSGNDWILKHPTI